MSAKSLSTLVVVGLSFGLMGLGCIPTDNGDPKPGDMTLRKFSSPEELRAFLVQQAAAQNTSYRGGVLFFDGRGGAAEVTNAPMAGPPSGSDNSTGAGGQAGDFSTTNIQEAGVDESDIVKNDAGTIFVLEGDTIHIVRALPANSLTELASIKIKTSGDSLYLRGDLLIALSRQYGYYLYGSGGGLLRAGTTVSAAAAEDDAASDSSDGSDVTDDFPPGPFEDTVRTTVTLIDVSDPARPQVKATYDFQGHLVSSRLIENRLRLVMTTTPALPYGFGVFALNRMTLSQWVPDYQFTDEDGTTSVGDIADWQDFYRPSLPDGYGITTVVTLDVDNPAPPFASTAISANAGIIYASTDALYVTDNLYDYTAQRSRQDTIIHKLRFNDEGTSYVGSGLVPGRVLNQYSLGEYEGYLRIATTNEEFSVDRSSMSSGVYVLGEAGTSLEVVGKVENIAPGEQIYAARFIGKRGFLVTFMRIDPLFTLDLSDPTKPRIVGELKVPGYSDHIQLLDENHLLTIGRETQDAGSFAWIQGLQLSIFDVTDPAKPTQLHVETIGSRGTYSEANDNPKAFNYFAARGLLAFPVDYYGGNTFGAQYGTHQFTGLYVYRVSVGGGFEFLGRIGTSPGINNRGCYVGYSGFTRGVFIGDVVYAVTSRGVKSANVDAMSTLLGQLEYPGAPGLYEDCYYLQAFPSINLPEGEGLR